MIKHRKIMLDDPLPSTKDGILAEKEYVDQQIGLIKSSLDTAAAKRRATGEYSDPEWFNKARIALRMMGQRSQKLQRALSKLRVKTHSNRSPAEYFVDVAKQRLPSEQFQSILQEAVERKSLESAN